MRSDWTDESIELTAQRRAQIVQDLMGSPGARTWKPGRERKEFDQLAPVLRGLNIMF